MVKKKTQSQAVEAASVSPKSKAVKHAGEGDTPAISQQKAAGKSPAVVQSPGAATAAVGATRSQATKQRAKDEIDQIFAGKRKAAAAAAEVHPDNEDSVDPELRELAEQVHEARSKVCHLTTCCLLHHTMQASW